MAPPLRKLQKNNSKAVGTKLNKHSKPALKSMALQHEDDVPDFPRGGGSSLSHRERKAIHAEVDAEFGNEETKLKKKSMKKRQRTNTDGDDLGSLFGDGISGKLPKFANRITMKNVTPGMKLLGVVAEVNEKDLAISLPGGLRGLVRITDAFDTVQDCEVKESKLLKAFHVGQLVSCTVLQVDDGNRENGKRKIRLSLKLSLLYKGFTVDGIQEGMVLTAYVKSIEDHGYILDFGLPAFTGFLPKDSQSERAGIEVKIGQLLQGVARKIDKIRKVVYLCSDPEAVSKSVIKDLKGISIDLLIPGMMVNARVQSTLGNGIMLSFLTYFTGTVDMFHLQNTFASANWKDDYSQNKKVNARILFVDPSTRAVALTLNPHLVQNNAPSSLVKIGDIFDNAKVVRVDKSSGLMLQIPSIPIPTPAYVSISDVAEKEAKKLEKKYKEGSNVHVRILGFRHLEGLANGVLKASDLEGPVLTHTDVKPGMMVKAKIIAVDSFGAFVQFPGGVKAFCPVKHMSEFEIAKAGKKFKNGAELVFRVLGCKSKRITVTHKKTLVKSKLGILSSYADATEGLKTHGWITKIENHGCFVHFYNGVQGFAPRSQLGLEPGSESSSMYHVGQVVKCRILSSIPSSKRITLSFLMKSARISEDDVVKIGNLVSGVVEKVTPAAVIVCIGANGHLKGSISNEHLSDHREVAGLIKSTLKPGHEFDQLLILDIEATNLILSAKYSLVRSAEALPSEPSQIRPQSVIHGYICNIIETGCFVRFLGRLTGFCSKSKAVTDRKASLFETFYVGQSVRAHILDVNSETNRITLSLQQTRCASVDASFIQELFLLNEKIGRLQSSDSKRTELDWVEGFTIGSVIEAKVQEIKEFGVVVSFEKHNDVLGFITNYQLGGSAVEVGSIVQAVVLDIAKTECLVDLSLKPEFLNSFTVKSSGIQTLKKKRKRDASKEFQLHQTVNAIVEVVKENYLVLSLPEYNYTIGYASVADYNTQNFPRIQFQNGQSITATIVAIPNLSSAGRLLLLLNSITESSRLKKAKQLSNYSIGSLVQAEVTEIKPLELRVKLGTGSYGRIHITEVNDGNDSEDPFVNFKVGQTVTARIIAKPDQSDYKRRGWELSIKETVVAGSYELEKQDNKGELNFLEGGRVNGYVYKVDNEWAWLTISQRVRAQLYILDSSSEPTELQKFQKRFLVGKAVSGYVLKFNRERNIIRLALSPVSDVANRTADSSEHLKVDDAGTDVVDKKVTSHFHEGDILGGRILKVLPGVGGLFVQIGPHLHGRVHFTELNERWVSDPLAGYHEGQFVKCKVLEISESIKGSVQIDLSLCLFTDDILNQSSEEGSVGALCKKVEKIEDLHPNMTVQGYVKSTTTKGCFILLSRKLEAKVLLKNLSDRYIDDIQKEYPVGKLVNGRVLSVEPLSKRIEVTLKTGSSNTPKFHISELRSLHVGDIVSGSIRRVEPYGLFITINDTNTVGLCHISELSDEHVDNLEEKYRAGEKVTAKILKVDEERLRIALGMKSSYLKDAGDILSPVQDSDEEAEDDDSMDDLDIKMHPSSPSSVIEVTDNNEIEEFGILAQANSRSSIPPLEVTLDEVEHSEMDTVTGQNQGLIDNANTVNEKKQIQKNRKSKDEREQEIRAAEERLLETNIPVTTEEFEKLVRSSPNSSLVWMKYMAFVLSLADVEKARSIADRALSTINVREENEKLNIWVAYFNLENEYGSPPEEAVMKVFQRALQYCDSKKIHMALLGMYERTEQHKLADDLVNKMTKKFKHSCKVWLKRMHRLISQQQDGVQAAVQRALLCLPHHKHIKFISHTAILEYKLGVRERGQSLFEGVLREYPKRTDLWSVYLDQEIRLGDVDVIRGLFERAISLSLPFKKMKFLFKKYLVYETALGDEERIEYVKQKAIEYVERTQS